ncbi:indole-3-glycerol phosphate synthase TrpC [Rhodoluna lacicola]|uniref:indole-3-glycerol phosphate synthase TrpC n=1 Tax=Rhodoluna lacicola TaxID=529884 RepID=UPI002231040E|nr:indole-3-glycerol phosphate synthase TrpC [Rhodoluna lacicola]BDS50459.1 indole-3-glycerol phosphate synthase [Rhodoluna lacicola]
MLSDLYAGSLADAARRLESIPLKQVEAQALARPAAFDAMLALAPSSQIKVLAEVKRASPSKGQMAEIQDPAALARIYADNGASAISVLTEERKFKGSLQDLEAVRESVQVPLLRKDFIATEHQILEARAAGADIILLIVAGLPEADIARLMKFTFELGMTPFIETHSEEELKIALGLGAALIGVNARDLSTFETNRDLFGELVDLIPSGVIKVAESAVRNADDVAHYRKAGADVVLVGEALVTNDPAAMLRSFLQAGKS